MPPLLKRTIHNLIKQIWRLFFKLLILPLYKIYLISSKKINYYFIHNPYLTKQQKQKTLWINSITHLIIITITLLVVIFNASTRETYAEEFNKNSIFAQLFAAENYSEEIIEKAPSYHQSYNHTKSQTILNQLTALKAKSNTPKTVSDHTKLIAISPAGDALIKAQAALFAEKTTAQNNKQNSKQTGISKNNSTNRQSIQTYIVKKGDTLSTIAKKFNLSINTILWENKLSLNSYIRPGDKLTILPVDGISYTIKSGDTISSIARRYGSTINKILAYNQISSVNKIRVNEKIIIPGGKFGRTPVVTPTKTLHSYKKSVIHEKKFVWPTNSKRITQYYHWRHHAIDIANRIGQPIYAPISGRVIKAGWSRGYGYNVVIDNGHGIRTRTAHASKLYVKYGQLVKQGQVVAAVGSTGWSTGPHVHFEIIINNVKVNPLNYF